MMTQTGQTRKTLSRRGFLKGIGGITGAALGGVASPLVAKAYDFDTVRKINLKHVRTDETVSTVYFEGGFYDPNVMTQLDWLMRDYTQDAALMMDVRLFDVLAGIQKELGKEGVIHVTSGYRTPETNAALRTKTRYAAKNSLHMQGMAADFYVPGVSAKKLERIARNLKMGGVGGYSGARFIHVDVGPVRSWRR